MGHDRYPKRPAATSTLNVRLLVWSVVVVAVLSPTLYAVWTVQVRRNTGILLERSEELQKQGDLTGAARTLYRYLQFRPDDGPARVMLAEVFDKTATTIPAKSRATEHYYRALSYFQDRQDLRVRLAELLLEIDRQEDAERESLVVLFGDPRASDEVASSLAVYQDKLQLHRFLETNPQAARALAVLAKVVCGKSDSKWLPADQLTVVTNALAANPTSIELVLLQAKVYREVLTEGDAAERARTADTLVTEHLSEHPDAGKANLALFRYRSEHQLPDADAALKRALEAAPKDYEVLLAAASQEEARKELDRAAEYLKRAIEVTPESSQAYAALARILLQQDKPRDCAALCRKGLDRCKDMTLSLDLALVRALLQSRDFTEAQEHLSKVKQKQEKLAPMLTVAARDQLNETISVFDAELAVADKKLVRAAAILRQLVLLKEDRSSSENLRVRQQRWHRLGEVYDQLQYWELAAKAYEEEAALDPANYPALIAASRAWRLAGRQPAAISSLETALQASNAQPTGWLLLARAEMERQLRSPLRDWAKVDAALSKAKDLLGETTDVLATEVELTAAKGDNAGAAKMLEEGLKSKPDELFPFAVLFYERSGRADDANKALDQWKELRGADDRQVRLLELQIYRRQKNYDGAKALLLTLLKESTGEEERDLRRQLAMLELEHDDAGGRQALLALAQRYPDSPWPLERLADLAFAARDDQALAKYESALQKAEGPDGSIWRFYRAMRLLNQASDPNDERLVEATQLVSELQSLRPMWPRVLHLKARLAQKQNRVQESIEAYQAAIEAGETSIALYEGLVALLYANNRWAEADQLLSRLNQRDQSPLLESFSSRVLLKRGQIDEAVAAAKSAVQMRPKDPLAHIWLGQTLSAASRQSPKQDERDNLWKDAKSALEQAVALAPEDAGAWSALLAFRVRAGDKEGAQAAIEAIQTKVNLPKPKHALAIAQGYQLLGEYQLADKHFREAVQLSPRDPEAQERLLQFYLAYSPEKGEQAARRLLELEPTSDLARRTLATLLATQGSDSQFEEAIQLLRGSADDAANRRLHALLLMRRGGKTNLAEAHSILSGLVNQAATPSAMDRRLLALVAEAEGDLETARNQLEALAGDGGSASYLATLIDFLLRHKQPKEAEPLVNRLISLEPNSFVTTQLHARWMQASERPASDIEGVIQSYLTAAIKAAAGAPQQVAVVKGAASLFAQLSMQPQAEAAFRGLLRDFPSDAARQALAMWLVGQERFGEAVQVALDGIRADMPTDASAQLLGNVLVLASSRGVRFNDAERTLEELVAAKGQNANLLVELATLKHIQGDRDARRVYERAIQLAPRNALARNNLAMLLLEQPATYGESLKNIKEALQYAGPLPDLKDTEALALMQLGNTEEAVRILRILLAQSPGNARFLFHLAIAYDKAGNKSAAREELQKALGKNLKQEVLTPMERALLAELHPLVATSLE